MSTAQGLWEHTRQLTSPQYLGRRQNDDSDQNNVHVGAQRMILIDVVYLQEKQKTTVSTATRDEWERRQRSHTSTSHISIGTFTDTDLLCSSESGGISEFDPVRGKEGRNSPRPVEPAGGEELTRPRTPTLSNHENFMNLNVEHFCLFNVASTSS